MKNQREENKVSLLGEYTPAKAAGAAFSVASVLPTLLFLLVLVVLSLCGLTKNENYAQSDWYIYLSFLTPQIAFFALLLYVLRYSKQPKNVVLQSQKCSVKYYIIAILLQIGLLSLSELNSLFLRALEKIGYENSEILLPSLDGFGFVGAIVVVALLPAVMEEAMFRGVLLRGLRSFKTGWAVVICGALFSLYHQNPAQTVYQFCCGACFALVAVRAGSILPTVVAHFLNNAFILALTKAGVTAFSTPVLIAVVIPSAICLLGTLAYLIFFDKNAPKRDGDTGEKKRFFKYASLGIVVCAIAWVSVLVAGL
ncbi:MAG: CPBP family intramembrane metalloprotease [Clostridia bacterium]|nr:CPBP family intramembrane metalloprotease [Clostridia bacterium]